MQVRREGESKLGTKVEVKNMNSFAAMQRAIDFEISRQVLLLLSCLQLDVSAEALHMLQRACCTGGSTQGRPSSRGCSGDPVV